MVVVSVMPDVAARRGFRFDHPHDNICHDGGAADGDCQLQPVLEEKFAVMIRCSSHGLKWQVCSASL